MRKVIAKKWERLYWVVVIAVVIFVVLIVFDINVVVVFDIDIDITNEKLIDFFGGKLGRLRSGQRAH